MFWDGMVECSFKTHTKVTTMATNASTSNKLTPHPYYVKRRLLGDDDEGDKEQPPRRGTDILWRNTEAASVRVCLLRGRHPQWWRILVLRRVPQVWRETRWRMKSQQIRRSERGGVRPLFFVSGFLICHSFLDFLYIGFSRHSEK